MKFLWIYRFFAALQFSRDGCLTKPEKITILQTEEALTALGQLSILLVKRLTARLVTGAVNLFFYHRLSSGKTLPWPQRSDGSHPRSGSTEWERTWAVRESPKESSDIPPFAFKAPGRVLPKKVSSRNLCFVLCNNRRISDAGWKAWPPICNQRLITSVTQSLT